MRDIRRPIGRCAAGGARHNLEINSTACIGEDVSHAALVMQAIFNPRLARRETGGGRRRRGGRDAVNFAGCVIMGADFDIFVVIRTPDTDEKSGIRLFIGGLSLGRRIKNITEPHRIGTLVLIPFDPEQRAIVCRPDQRSSRCPYRHRNKPAMCDLDYEKHRRGRRISYLWRRRRNQG